MGLKQNLPFHNPVLQSLFENISKCGIFVRDIIARRCAQRSEKISHSSSAFSQVLLCSLLPCLARCNSSTQVKELELSLHVGGSIIPDPKYRYKLKSWSKGQNTKATGQDKLSNK